MMIVSLNAYDSNKSLYYYSEKSFSVFKKGIKCIDLGFRWGNYLSPTLKKAYFMKESSNAYRCTYIPMLIFDSIGLFREICFFCKKYLEGKRCTSEEWKKSYKNTYTYMGRILKDCYSINRLREELSDLRQGPFSHIFGGVLLISKGVESGCFLGRLYCNYSDRIKEIENKCKEDPKVGNGIYQDLFFKVLGAVCWVVSCVLTGLSMSYVLPLRQIVLYTNTIGFVVSLLKSFNCYYFNLST